MAFDPIISSLRAKAESATLLLDVDGTLAPIVADPDDAAVPSAVAAELIRLADCYRLVACISGRRATDARRIVGLAGLAYAGNHGLELLGPGEERPRVHPRLGDFGDAAKRFLATLDGAELASGGVRLEDKGPIQAIHWRGVADEVAAQRHAESIAARAAAAGLRTHRGRMVIEIRPDVDVDKGDAVRELVGSVSASAGLYAGDDRTDLDAFAALRQLALDGQLELAVCVGVASEEGPPEIQREADLVVNSSAELLDLLREL